MLHHPPHQVFVEVKAKGEKKQQKYPKNLGIGTIKEVLQGM
jgi:hypothetical protein